MERYSFQNIEKKWRNNISFNSVKNPKSDKKFYCLEMFPIRLGRFIWVTSELYYWRCSSRYKFLNG